MPGTKRWYIYREGDHISLDHLDQAGALLLHQKGYELGPFPFDDKDEAVLEAEAWRKRLESQVTTSHTA
jgi:hypothetical protein